MAIRMPSVLLVIALTLVMLLAESIPAHALTNLQAGYFSRTGAGGDVDRPEIFWENPGAVSFANRFCTYRTQPVRSQTDRLGVYTSYATTSFADAAMDTPDYASLATTGILQYFGVLGQSCQNVANGAGLTPTTTTSQAVPMAHYLNPSFNGSSVNFTLSNPTNYSAVYAFVVPQEAAPQPYYLVGTFSGSNAAQGQHAVSFSTTSLPNGLHFRPYTVAVLGPVNPATIDPLWSYPPAGSLASRGWIDPNNAFTFLTDATPPTPPPENLNVVILEQPAKMRFTWTIPAGTTYQNIQVMRNGTLWANLAGNVTSYDFNNQPFGDSVDYGLIAYPPVGDPSPLVQARAPVTTPGRATIVDLFGGGVGFTVTMQKPDGVYDGPNQIQRDHVRYVNVSSGVSTTYTNEPSGLYPMATYVLPVSPGTYDIYVSIDAHNITGAEDGPQRVVVAPPPGPMVYMKHTPRVDAQGRTNPSDYYLASFKLADSQRGEFTSVTVRDSRSNQLLATLTYANNFQADNVAFCNPGNFRYTAIGYLSLNGSQSVPVDRTRVIPAMANDMWGWINDVADNNHGHRGNLRIRANLPACMEQTQRQVVINDYHLTNNTWNLTRTTLALQNGQDILQTSYNYPLDHSKDGRHIYIAGVQFRYSDENALTSALSNNATMNLGTRPGDLNGDDRLDINDIIWWIVYYSFHFNLYAPHDPNSLNFDQDRFITDSMWPAYTFLGDCGSAPDYRGDGVPEVYEDWGSYSNMWYWWIMNVFYGQQTPRGAPQGMYTQAVPNDPNNPNACISQYIHHESQGAYNQYGRATEHGPHQTGYPSQVEAVGYQNAHHNH